MSSDGRVSYYDQEKRFEYFEGRFRYFDGRFKYYDGRFKYFDNRFEHFDDRNDALQARIECSDNRNSALQARIERLETLLDATPVESADAAAADGMPCEEADEDPLPPPGWGEDYHCKDIDPSMEP